MGSIRLPSKSLMPLWKDYSLLELVICRITRSKRVHKVILATSNNPLDDALIPIAEKYHISVFRGSEDDVLGRFFYAFSQYPSDAIVRACADNPLLDPERIDELVDFFWNEQPCDYASNLGPMSGYPDGVGVEIVSKNTLIRIFNEASDPSDREHVVTYIKENPSFISKIMQSPVDYSRPQYRLDIDYEEDFQCMKNMIELLPLESAPLWRTMDIINTLDKHPELLDLRKKRE
jgi:spore coat polysaccharide biosynthesis protein SpsF